MIRIQLSIFILLVAFCCITRAQQPPKPAAQQFADFGTISKKYRAKKVEEFHEALKKNDGTRGVIINYGIPSDLKIRKDAIMKDWLGCDAFNGVRVIWINAKSESHVRTVFWLVPPGADLPKP